MKQSEFLKQMETLFAKLKKNKSCARTTFGGGLIFRCARDGMAHVVLFGKEFKGKVKDGKYRCSKCGRLCENITYRMFK